MMFSDFTHYTDLKACISYIFYARSLKILGMALQI